MLEGHPTLLTEAKAQPFDGCLLELAAVPWKLIKCSREDKGHASIDALRGKLVFESIQVSRSGVKGRRLVGKQL